MNWENNGVRLLCAGIVAAGIVGAGALSANILADRPLFGSFSGSLSQGGAGIPDLMRTRDLLYYMDIFPEEKSAGPETGAPAEVYDYDSDWQLLEARVEDEIARGQWPGFPYVHLEGRYYFSKQAVDDWFAMMGEQQWRAD